MTYKDEEVYCEECKEQLTPGETFKSVCGCVFCSDHCMVEWFGREYKIEDYYVNTAEDIAMEVGDQKYHELKDEAFDDVDDEWW